MLKVGFIGIRGMVGSVLLDRMLKENDFDKIQAIFFSTSNIGGVAPTVKNGFATLEDAYNLESLLSLDCIVTAQGSEYTEEILPKLRNAGFTGYWIDASSYLRMSNDAVIILDPINLDIIETSLKSGVKNFVGGNCTVSLMLLAIDGLIKNDLVEWVSSMTYQAVSGAGANNMREFLQQSNSLSGYLSEVLNNPAKSILEIEKEITQKLLGNETPIEHFKAPLFCNLLPWIDRMVDNGQTREEWKATSEANKILGNKEELIKIDGLCVRVGSLRCHSQALTIKLKQKLKLDEITNLITNANQWVRYVPNLEHETRNSLTPLSVSGTLDIAVGRLHKMNFGEEYLTLFTVGDQLLWGAAEPLRRMISILVKHHG